MLSELRLKWAINLTASPPTNEEETGKIEPWIQQLWDALEDTQR